MADASATSPLPSKGQAGVDPWSIPLERIDVADSELFETDTHWGFFERLRRDDLGGDEFDRLGLGLQVGEPVGHGDHREMEHEGEAERRHLGASRPFGRMATRGEHSIDGVLGHERRLAQPVRPRPALPSRPFGSVTRPTFWMPPR